MDIEAEIEKAEIKEIRTNPWLFIWGWTICLVQPKWIKERDPRYKEFRERIISQLVKPHKIDLKIEEWEKVG